MTTTTNTSLNDIMGARLLQPYSDARLKKREVERACEETLAQQDGYWTGLLCCRPDPAVRAVRVFYHKQTKRPQHRMFSYDELISTATLILMGIPKRVAAAMTFHKLAMAVPHGESFDVGDRDAAIFNAVGVRLQDGSLWDVLIEKTFNANTVEFVGDFAVWFDFGGKKSDPDDAEFPTAALEVIEVGEAKAVPLQ